VIQLAFRVELSRIAVSDFDTGSGRRCRRFLAGTSAVEGASWYRDGCFWRFKANIWEIYLHSWDWELYTPSGRPLKILGVLANKNVHDVVA